MQPGGAQEAVDNWDRKGTDVSVTRHPNIFIPFRPHALDRIPSAPTPGNLAIVCHNETGLAYPSSVRESFVPVPGLDRPKTTIALIAVCLPCFAEIGSALGSFRNADVL